MDNIKLCIGLVIIIGSAAVLGIMYLAKLLHISIPKFFVNNQFEILLLIIASCVMGLVLIVA